MENVFLYKYNVRFEIEQYWRHVLRYLNFCLYLKEILKKSIENIFHRTKNIWIHDVPRSLLCKHIVYFFTFGIKQYPQYF